MKRKRDNNGEYIELNNDPAEIFEFIDHLGESLDDALNGKDEHDWAMDMVEDLRTVTEIVAKAIERSRQREAQFSFPFMMNGTKS